MGFNLFNPSSYGSIFNQAPAQIAGPGAAGGSLSTATSMAGQAAMGQGPSAAEAQQRAALIQAQKAAQSQAVSTRGDFGLAGAQRSAQATEAGMDQNAINAAAAQRAQEQEAARAQYIQGAGTGASIAAQQADQQAQLTQQQNDINQQQNTKLFTGAIGALSSAGGALSTFSDATLKKDMQPGDHAADQFLATLQPHAFTWEDPSKAPNPKAAVGPNLGIHAQDIEKSPWGQSIVQDDPATGKKKLDMHALTSALAAGMGETKKKQDAHEMRLSQLEKVVHATLGPRG